MVKFVPVDPDDVPNFRESRRGRVSYPILKSFLETGMVMAKLDRTGIQQSLQSLNSSLGAYIRNHNLPIKMFTRRGEIYLARTDINEETGEVDSSNNNIDRIPRVRDQVGIAPAELKEFEGEIPEVDDEEVEARFGVEKNLSTK
jgi:hypothetical protein